MSQKLETKPSQNSNFWAVLWKEFRLSLSTEFVYRWRVLVWVVSDLLQPIIFAALWIAVARSTTRDISTSQMISYYYMAVIVNRLTQDWSIQLVPNAILKGEFYKYLLRPFNYLTEMLGVSLSTKFIRIIILIPILTTSGIALQDYLEYDFEFITLFYFTLAIIIGFTINFFLGNIVSLIAVYIKQIQGIKALYINSVSILSGQTVPILVFPLWALFIIEILPFRYVLSFPIEIIIGSIHQIDIHRGFAIAFIWLIVLIVLYKLIYKISIKKYEAEGL